jgi:hypothetical protein
MIATELEEIKSYWNKKYPQVDIRLWGNDDNSKYFGHMINHESNEHFQANTVGELINLGEQFLRKVKQ